MQSRSSWLLCLGLLPALAGCESSHQWTTPLASARCDGVALKAEEEGRFIGGEIYEYLFSGLSHFFNHILITRTGTSPS